MSNERDEAWLTRHYRSRLIQIQDDAIEKFMDEVRKTYHDPDRGWTHDEMRSAVCSAFNDDTGYDLFDAEYGYTDPAEEN